MSASYHNCNPLSRITGCLQECLHDVLGQLKQIARENTACDDNDNHHRSEEGCRGREVDRRQLLVRVHHESCSDHLDVVVEGDGNIDHSNEHEQEVSPLHCRGKDEELSSKSDCRRDTSQTRTPFCP